jgi:nucleoid DNA-binding protein
MKYKKATEDFFFEVSKKCNYINPELVKEFYVGFVRTILEELKKNGSITLPDWGTIKLIRHKARMYNNIATGQVEQLEAKNTIKFYPDYKLKAYTRNLDITGT